MKACSFFKNNCFHCQQNLESRFKRNFTLIRFFLLVLSTFKVFLVDMWNIDRFLHWTKNIFNYFVVFNCKPIPGSDSSEVNQLFLPLELIHRKVWQKIFYFKLFWIQPLQTSDENNICFSIFGFNKNCKKQLHMNKCHFIAFYFETFLVFCWNLMKILQLIS